MSRKRMLRVKGQFFPQGFMLFCCGTSFHMSGKVYPLKFKIDTKHDAVIEAGDTFSKARHFWYLLVTFRGSKVQLWIFNIARMTRM